jgi:hypothetical protein
MAGLLCGEIYGQRRHASSNAKVIAASAWLAHLNCAVIPDKRRSRADPGSIGGPILVVNLAL